MYVWVVLGVKVDFKSGVDSQISKSYELTSPVEKPFFDTQDENNQFDYYHVGSEGNLSFWFYYFYFVRDVVGTISELIFYFKSHIPFFTENAEN